MSVRLSRTLRTPRCSETTPSQCSVAPGRTPMTEVSNLLVSPNGPSPTRSAPSSLKVIRWLPSSTVRLPIQMGW